MSARTATARFVTRREAVDSRIVGWMEDSSPLLWLHGRDVLVGWGPALRIPVGTGDDRFRRVAAELEGVLRRLEVDDEVGGPGSGPLAFGSFSFDPSVPGSVLKIPTSVAAARGGESWLTTSVDGEIPRPRPERPGPEVRYAGSTMSELAWIDAVAAAIDRVRRHELEKVVLARDLLVRSRHPFDVRTIAARLAAAFPGCYTFHVDGLVGATPELLIRRMGTSVESIVLAGSAPRGEDATADRALGDALLASDKDRDEHILAVRSVRDSLTPHCSALEIEHEPSLLRLANVQHLATRVTGSLASGATALELAGALHPTAAVCGAPTPVAQEAIRSLEGMERGRYGGPVGWVDGRGDGEWGIALRCAELNGTRGRLFAGAGVVAESLPEEELEETRLKLLAMQSVLGPRSL